MKKYLRFIMIILILVLGFNTVSYAEVSISTTNVNMYINQTKNVTLNGNGVTGTVSVVSSNPNVATASVSSNWIENNSVTVSIYGKSVGNATITVSGKVANSSTGAESDYLKTISINVSSNQTSSSGNSNTNSNTNNNSNSGAQTTNSEKSNIATLSNLGIKPNDFSGFKATTYSYNVEVPNNIETIEVYANKGQSGQTISGTGKKTLKEGTNAFNVVVTAEDGKTQKTYTINVTRKQKEEDTPEETPEENTEENPMEEVYGLTELKIEGIELEPEFQTDVYEYKIELKEDIDKLDITTLATEPGADIEIAGNENLQEGENIITIIVKGDNEGKTTAYQIIVNKVLPKEETTNQNNEYFYKKIILISASAVIVIIVVILVIIKFRKNSNDSEYVKYTEFYANDMEELNKDEQIENDKEDFYDEEPKKKKRSKGKRFK